MSPRKPYEPPRVTSSPLTEGEQFALVDAMVACEDALRAVDIAEQLLAHHGRGLPGAFRTRHAAQTLIDAAAYLLQLPDAARNPANLGLDENNRR